MGGKWAFAGVVAGFVENHDLIKKMADTRKCFDARKYVKKVVGC
jgi:hypothetical protein